jgi:hypothetical protein
VLSSSALAAWKARPPVARAIARSAPGSGGTAIRGAEDDGRHGYSAVAGSVGGGVPRPAHGLRPAGHVHDSGGGEFVARRPETQRVERSVDGLPEPGLGAELELFHRLADEDMIGRRGNVHLSGTGEARGGIAAGAVPRRGSTAWRMAANRLGRTSVAIIDGETSTASTSVDSCRDTHSDRTGLARPTTRQASAPSHVGGGQARHRGEQDQAFGSQEPHRSDRPPRLRTAERAPSRGRCPRMARTPPDLCGETTTASASIPDGALPDTAGRDARPAIRLARRQFHRSGASPYRRVDHRGRRGEGMHLSPVVQPLRQSSPPPGPTTSRRIVRIASRSRQAPGRWKNGPSRQGGGCPRNAIGHRSG